MARKFTDERVPNAVSLTILDPKSQRTLAHSLGVSEVAQISARLADRNFVRERLASLPPLCLIMLEVLVEAGGALIVRHWFAITSQRTKVPVDIAQHALPKLFDSGLLVGSYAGNALQQVAVPAAASGALYDLLAGISLPSAAPPVDAPVGALASRSIRDSIALCALAAHRRLRFTQIGNPDRSALKRLIKDLGMTLDGAEALIGQARALGWFTEERERALPNAVVLIDAGQRISPSSPAAEYADLIGEQSWTSVEALARRAGRSVLESIFGHSGIDRLVRILNAEPCLQLSEHAGHQWVRRRAAEQPFGDGHVTPSFDVMLGPAAALGTVARVGLCCELMRVDHMLTLKLTPESVAAGLACGLSPDELRAGLAAVSPHGLPDNVRFMLEDWIAATRFARVRQGLFVFTDEQIAERMAAELGDELLDRPLPGVLELRATCAGAPLDKALAKAKAVLRSNRTGAVDRTVARSAANGQSLAKLRPLPTPDADLRGAVQRAHERGDYGVDATEEESINPLAELARVGREQGAPKELFELLDAIGTFHNSSAHALRAWASRKQPRHAAGAALALELPIVALPWLVLSDDLRARVLKQAPSLEALLRHAQVAMTQPHALRSGGARAVELMRHPAVLKAIQRATALLARDADEGDDEEVLVLPDELVEAFAGQELTDEFEQGTLRAHNERTLPAVQRARQERDSVLNRQPCAGTLLIAQPGRVRELLVNASESEQIVHLQFAGGRVQSVLAEELRRRGRDEVLHCIDIEQVQARVIKLSDIAAAQLDNA